MKRFMHVALLLTTFSFITAQNFYHEDKEYQCPQHWVKFQENCYRFIKSPIRIRDDARRNCQLYQSDLVTISSLEEHGFLLHQLQWHDPLHRKWYTGVKFQGNNWTNEADDTKLVNMHTAFFSDPNDLSHETEYLVYSFSNKLKRWGLEKVTGYDEFLYICEAPMSVLYYLKEDNRTYMYGVDIDNPLKIPRGPFFIKQPVNSIFSVYKEKLSNDISMKCLAGGYPTPTYEWYKEQYENDRLVAKKIDPLSNARYTLSGGMLIIHEPNQTTDQGIYHCRATNEFGTIKSESVELSFGYIMEFNMKRSTESGEQNWGKVIYCDPPQHYPEVKYKWNRDFFPNFVEEDQRVFVSHDSALYFSSLESIDRGYYSCSVQSISTNNGRTGPFFQLKVNSDSSFQQLKFPNNFPKVFPEAPIAGEEVRLECIAFGYPVPSYNWTRKGAALPGGAIFSSYNRVLTIPHVKVDDQGEYICQATNERLSIANSVILSIQAAPTFTVPLTDKHVDYEGDLTWTCEAFGIPDVAYKWLRNGEIFNEYTLLPEDRDRYFIQDNVMKIFRVDPERDEAMYQCAATNQLKTIYSSAQLRVLSFKPSFKKQPLESETYASEKGNVTIVCNPEAAPRPKFMWKKDGNVIKAGKRITILSGNLVITSVSQDDEGMYSCTASNQYGSDESRGRLIVLRGPRFIEMLPPRITITVGKNQILRCRADIDEILDVAYIWMHNGMIITNKDFLFKSHLVVTGGTLKIVSATMAEAGEYACVVRSSISEIISKTIVNIEGPPGPPGAVQVGSILNSTVILYWTDGANNGKEILMYTISARTNWNQTWFNISENIRAKVVNEHNGRKEACLKNVLNPFTTYEFRIYSYNELGYGPPSAPTPQYSTLSNKPYKYPSHIGGGGGKIGDLTIEWEPLPPADQNGPGIHYKIFWRRKYHGTEFQSIDLKKYGNIRTFIVQIPPAYFYTEYEVKVQAINEIGSGPISEPVTIFSAENMPTEAPQQVIARSFNSTALNVTWQPVNEGRKTVKGKLIGYRIKYWMQSKHEETATYYLSRTTRPWTLVVGLQPDTYYMVKVMAYNSAGEGPESEKFIERTWRKAPQNPPSAVHVRAINPSTVRVAWRYGQPSMEEESLIGFKVRIWEVDRDMSTAKDTLVSTGNNLETFITNLSPGKTYNLRVLAYSLGGDGRMSSPTHTFQMGDKKLFANSS